MLKLSVVLSFLLLYCELRNLCFIMHCIKPGSYFLRMRCEFDVNIAAIFARELSTTQLLRTISCEFLTSTFISYSKLQEEWIGLNAVYYYFNQPLGRQILDKSLHCFIFRFYRMIHYALQAWYFTERDEGDCFPSPWSLPWWPWNAPVEISSQGALSEGKHALVPLPFQKWNIQAYTY